MLATIQFDPQDETPIYRQVYEQIKIAINSRELSRGEKLPATRELAGLLGLNRTTVSAAYELLEAEGLISGQVGRGSYVEGPEEAIGSARPDATISRRSGAERISFASSRPSELLFPLDEFRATCREVIDSADAKQILQLGPAGGYGPLRRYLLEEARNAGAAGPFDDILITSGCQQAFDLMQRVLASHGETVLLEDPVYPGLRNVFQRGGARVVGVPVGQHGVDVDALARAIEREQPRLVVLTPNFQNPTGATMPEASRLAVLEAARRAGVVVVENDLYGELRYHGKEIPRIKQVDRRGDTILLSSFSKVAFPGLRVGWAIGPRPLIARLTEAKESCDLHSDQLAQAVLLRFALSGRLAAHRQRMLASGAERLEACVAACRKWLPPTSEFTRPEGGMNVWVKLPDPLDAADMAGRAEREGVSFQPGSHFSVSRPHTHELRLSFAGLDPEQIRQGMAVLGGIFRNELNRAYKGSVEQGREDTHVLV